MLNMERANGTVALYQRDHRSLIDWAARTILAAFGFVFIRFLPANVGFINFNHLVLSAQSLGHLTFSPRILRMKWCSDTSVRQFWPSDQALRLDQVAGS